MSLQFDQQRIAVRERNVIEIFDLALAVVRERGWPLFGAFVAGVLPFAILNGLLLGSLIWEFDPDDSNPYLGYWYLLVVLTTFEAPLATSLMTIYLGQTMFQDRSTFGEVLRDLKPALPQLLLYQFLVRGFLWLFQITIFVPYVFMPYLNEIILLEKNPLRGGTQRVVTTRRRSQLLHGASRGMTISRWMAALFFGAVMAYAVFGATWSVLDILAGERLSDRTAYLFLWPFALWTVMGFFAVVRFLCYLDLRIRTEGWEVELLMRAEASRLGRQWA